METCVGTGVRNCVGVGVEAGGAGVGTGARKYVGLGVASSVDAGVGAGVGTCVGVGVSVGVGVGTELDPAPSTRKTKHETNCSEELLPHVGLPLPVTRLHSSMLKVSVSMPWLSASMHVLLTFQTQRPTARPLGHEKVAGKAHRMALQPEPISQAHTVGVSGMKLTARSSIARSKRIQSMSSLRVSEQAISNHA